MTTGEKLRALRGSQTQDVVAQAIGITKSALSMYETGKRIPRDEIKLRLAHYYGLSVEFLFFTGGEH